MAADFSPRGGNYLPMTGLLAANPALFLWVSLIGAGLTLLIAAYLRPYILGGNDDPLQHTALRLFQGTAILTGIFLVGGLLAANALLTQKAPAPTATPPPQSAAPQPPPFGAATAPPESSGPQVVLAATSTPSEPSPTPLPQARIVNTGGAGVNVRLKPSTSAQIAGIAAEGTLVELLGETAQDETFSWERIRTPDGLEGWVVNRFLEPQP